MACRRLYFSLLIFGFALLAAMPQATAKTQGVEVIEVTGIIDSSVERSIIATIERAEREGAGLVVVQLSSRGAIGRDRVVRIARAIADSKVPVTSWVGPPGAVASNGAVLVATAAKIRGMAPGSVIGPLRTLDLRRDEPVGSSQSTFRNAISSDDALDGGLVDFVEPTLTGVLAAIEEEKLADLDSSDVRIRFSKLDLLGRILHAAAQPSIAYLLLLVGLVGVVFELFHPSTGPAGASGLVALGLASYGIATLGGSWIAVAVIVAGIAAFCVDLRFGGLGVFTAAGLAGLVAGSLLLFRSPYLTVSPWILAIGIVGMVLFLLGAMTRVLRDLRAIARGELEITDAHAHPEGESH